MNSMRFTTITDLGELIPWGSKGIGTQDKETFAVSGAEWDHYNSLLIVSQKSQRGEDLYFRACKLVIDESL